MIAIAVDEDTAPPVSVAVVLALGIALASAPNRRMRTTGRLLLAFLAVLFVVAVLSESLTALTGTGLALSVATGAFAAYELVHGRGSG